MADPSAPYPSTSYRYPQAPFYPQAPVPYQPPVGPAPGSQAPVGHASRPAWATDSRISRAVLGLIRADLDKIDRMRGASRYLGVDRSVVRRAVRELEALENAAYKGIREDRRREREARDSLYRAFDRARRFAYLFQGHQRKTRAADEARATLVQPGASELAVAELERIFDTFRNLRELRQKNLLNEVNDFLRRAAPEAGDRRPGFVHDSRLDAGHGPDPGHVRDRRLGGGSNPFRRGASDPSLGAGHGPDPDADRFREAAEWWSQQAGSRSPIHDHGNEHQWVPEVEPVYTHTSQQHGAGVEPPAWTARAGVPNHTRPVGRRR